MSEPTVVDVPESDRYELRLGDEVVGFVAYRHDGDVLDLVHTEIEPGHEGEGLGGRLARGVLEDLRARGVPARPSCPFIRDWVDKHPEFGENVVG